MSEKLSVVLVDDSRSVLAQLETLIDELPAVHVVGKATDGASGIRMIAGLRPDLVLMDIVMPEMDGLAALRVLQANYPEVRVVMVSSLGGMASQAEEAFRLGAIQVIGKPFDPEMLDALFERELTDRSEGDGGRENAR